ncbi:hypothetical protein A2368_00165 [Candidatus Collierbacteria bacterium RIFOXYB1_FULL_49_13]|uniref:Phosphomannomutase n=1 Tax=Candidatus Collierbacteria bacterium RIFOXYB1_FULL_49_13 TaxID=1817728 RepID=A0A1F5FJ32_9BACT|nr:MAG: hypothetical protein A2368_00165 [Candidatus Collierbacteria bacterium RIFOXYB1_FULL_49_13]
MSFYKIVSGINPQIFRGYDLRGMMGTDLSPDVYYTLGRAYATFLARRRIQSCPVGRDSRKNGAEYQEAFMTGLNDGGVDTIDIGLTLSQIIYFASYHFLSKGGTIVTASHNPPEYNGLKLGTGYSETMITPEIQELRMIAESGKFVEGKGGRKAEDISKAYREYILSLFSLKKRWKVVVDACNATAGLFLPQLLREAGCEVIEQNCDVDENFPLGSPDPTDVEVLERIAEGVKKSRADIGFGYDADGDRMAVVDGRGRSIWMDSIVAIFAKDVLSTMPGAPIVFNTFCSRQVKETIEAYGGKAEMWITGHSFIKAKVKELRSPFGGELSGHIFFMDNFFGHDDSAYASLRLLTYLERINKTLAEEMDSLPVYVSSPEIKIKLPDEVKFKVISGKVTDAFKKKWPQGEYTQIDGVRVDLPDRMAIVRASQNGPYAGVKFEGKTREIYEEMRQTVLEILKEQPEIVWGDPMNANEKALTG